MDNNLKVTAFGKVLIAGGYVILEKKYCGLVLSINSNFDTIINWNRKNNKSSNYWNNLTKIKLKIDTTSFDDNIYKYTLKFNFREKTWKLNQFGNKKINQYIDASLKICTLYLNNKIFYLNELPFQVNIKLVGSKHFYGINKNSKTGLGSSAALVSSFISAFFKFFNLYLIKSEKKITKEIAFKLATISHSLAQGKLGSGFDIASSFYGSLVFKRFLFDYNEFLEIKDHSNLDLYLSKINIKNCLKPFDLPKGLNILIGNINKGSNTTKMVKRVLEWRDCDREESDKIYSKINEIINNLQNCFSYLNSEHKKHPILYITEFSYYSFFNNINNNKYKKNIEIYKTLVKIKKNFKELRKTQFIMSKMINLDIEPINSFEILNQTDEVDGVIGSAVPGAGGSDAIFCIILDREQVKLNVKKIWEQNSVEMMEIGIRNGNGIKFD